MLTGWRIVPLCCRGFSHSLKVSGRVPHINGEEEHQENSKKPKRLNNIFRGLNTEKSQSQVCDNLFSNILYYEPIKDPDGLLVLNKPYGLPLNNCSDSAYSLSSSLSGLADRLEVKKLHVIKAAERWTSGITVLGTNEKTREKYEKCIKRSHTRRTFSSSYLCLVKGHCNLSRVESVSLKVVECPQVESPLQGKVHKEPVITRKVLSPYRALLEQNKRVHVHCQGIARSSKVGLSLVELQPSKTSKSFLQVYMADVGFPILGDALYDYRARAMMGHKVKLSTGHTLSKRAQILPSSLLEALGLAKGEEWILPKFVHHHRLYLEGWLGKGVHLTVFAPPPDHFSNTCKYLGINLDYKTLAEKDTLRSWEMSNKKKKKAMVVQEPCQQDDASRKSSGQNC